MFVVLLFLMLPQTIFADTEVGSAVFLDADVNQAINEIGTTQNIKVKLRFSASNEGNINIIIAGYGADNRPIPGVVWETVRATAENKDCVIHTTETPFSVGDATKIKVFAWEETTLTPVLIPNATLNAIFVPESGFTQKFNAADGITQETPLAVAKGVPVSAAEIFVLADGAAANSEFFKVFAKNLEGNAVDMSFAADTTDWTKATLTFNTTGVAELTALDYDFCVPSTAFVNVIEPVEKFSALVGKTESDPYLVATDSTVNVSELFEAVSDVEINSKDFAVSAQIVGEGTATAEFIADIADWTKGTVSFSGEGLIKLTAQDYDFCVPTELYVNVVEPIDRYTTKFDNTEDYLYRVGNQNVVSLSSLFAATGSELPVSDLNVTIDNVQGNADGVFTPNATDWSKGKIQFSGTGAVKVTVKDKYSTGYSLLLEVVNAKNVTTYSELSNTNCVFLNDITMASGGVKYFSNAALYGNGFTFDVSDGAYNGTGYLTENYLIYLNNSSLDNMVIVGAVYTEYGATAKEDYNRPVVLSAGNSVIANCYIANCASPVRVNGGNLEIINSTLKGGNYANLDIRNGHVVLDNITTINQLNGNDTAEDETVVVGLGIVVYHEQVLDTTTIEIKNGITQYNYFSKTQAEEYISDQQAKTLTNGMFSSAYSALQYKEGADTWINAGIISMTSAVGDDNITDIDDYLDASPTLLSTTGYVHTKKPDAASISAVVPTYVTAGQYVIAPAYSFEYPSAEGKKNYIAKTDGSNKYCYYTDGEVSVSFDQGDSVSFDTSILTVTKSGQNLDYSVALDGVDCTGQTITFDSTGEHTLTYTYTDDCNYTIDTSGNIETYSKTYTKNVYLSATSVAPDAKNAEFEFVSTGAATKTVTIGNDTYVMPDVSATSATVASKTVSGTTIYFPIVEGYTSNGKTSQTSGTKWYMLFPVFKNVIKITDYAEGGLGDAVTYDGSTTTLPADLAADSPGTIFQYASASKAPDTPSVYNSVLCYTSPEMEGVNRDEYNIDVKYIYKDNAGKTYYYYVRYHNTKITNNSTCLTGDTNITLADGSVKRIDEITYDDELLVWNLYSGEYEIVPPAAIIDHSEDYYNVLSLRFADGTVVKTINGHGFFNVEENKFIFIDESNVGLFTGRNFIKMDTEGYKTVELIDYEISNEYIGCYSILSAGYNNCITESMLSLTPLPGVNSQKFFDSLVIGENMKYDEQQMQIDIDKYGLFTYEELSNYMTYEQFIALNAPYLKIIIGKGGATYEEIQNMISEYVPEYP